MGALGKDESTEPIDPITAEKLRDLVKAGFGKKAEIELVKKQLKELNGEYTEMTSEILAHLDDLELANFKVPGFGNAIVQDKFSVKVPREPDEKQKLFDYLKERDQFMEMVTVNSQTLNSYYKQELEIAKDEGNEDFELPGVGLPMHYQSLMMKKG